MFKDIKTQIRTQLASQLLDLTPKILSRPLGIVPFSVKSQLLVKILQLIFPCHRLDGELDFLIGRTVAIHIVDLSLDFQVSFDGQWQVLEVTSEYPAEVSFKGQSLDLFLVAAGQEDPDTLFFQRKLSIEGDTELGLKVKSLLTSIDFEALPLAVQISANQLAKAIIALQALASENVSLQIKKMYEQGIARI